MGLVFGFYGKLPSQGDFVSRRLPWDFTEAWDAWLQAGLAQVRGERGPRWLDEYLTAPLWRFTLGPGLAGPSGWVGLWFPSVDRVGRHFPMTLAAALPPGQGLAGLAQDDASWLALEDLALQALDPATTLERYDAVVQRGGLAIGPVGAAPATAAWRVQDLPPDADAATAARVEAAMDPAPARFYSWGSDTVPPTLVNSPVLPEPARFGGFLHGQWEAAA